jgi:hypothetical protein
MNQITLSRYRSTKRTKEDYIAPAIACTIVVGIFVWSICSLMSEISKDKLRSGRVDGIIVRDDVVQTGSIPGRRGRPATKTYGRRIGWEFKVGDRVYSGQMDVSAISSYSKNDKIKLEYDPNNPSNNVVYSNFSNIGGYVWCVVMGLVTIATCGGSAMWVLN